MASGIIPVLTDERHLGAASHADIILDFGPREIFQHVQACRADRPMQERALHSLWALEDELRAALARVEAASRVYGRAVDRALARDARLNS